MQENIFSISLMYYLSIFFFQRRIFININTYIHTYYIRIIKIITGICQLTLYNDD
jgi:hypothetical protein